MAAGFGFDAGPLRESVQTATRALAPIGGRPIRLLARLRRLSEYAQARAVNHDSQIAARSARSRVGAGGSHAMAHPLGPRNSQLRMQSTGHHPRCQQAQAADGEDCRQAGAL